MAQEETKTDRSRAPDGSGPPVASGTHRAKEHAAHGDLEEDRVAPRSESVPLGSPASEPNSWKEQANRDMAAFATGEVPDGSTFARLYDVLSPSLYRFVARHVGDAGTAEDVVQDVFRKLIELRGRFDAKRSVVALAFAIARNRCVDLAKRTRFEVLLPEGDAECIAGSLLPATAFEAKDALRVIQEELRGWPVDQRHLFELVCLDGLSGDEVAAVFGTTANGVALRLRRLRQKLEGVLKG
jgi:RNA polymerase sigma factor (sigma-70 family)